MSAPEASLESLLARIARGERDLFLHVVRRFELMLRSYLASQIYDLADVDDLAQETFIAAYRDLASFRPGADFGAWLRGIARHRLLAYFRSLRRREAAVRRFQEEATRIAAQEIDAAAGGSCSDQFARLLQCIGKLPDKLRRVVHAGLEGLRPAALAEELGTTIAGVYQLHYRANQLLRECVKAEGVP